MIEYHPISAEDLSRIHQFGKQVLPGIFLGYALYAGRIWNGDIFVADIEELENLDAPEVQCRRLIAKEVITPKNGENVIFPIADGKVKLSRGDQVLRTSTFIRDHPGRGVEREDLRGESDGSSPLDSFPDDSEARNDFWSISGNYIDRHHVEPRVKLYVPKEESFPIPLRYIDVTRATSSTLDVLQERRINDYWNVDGSRYQSVAWTGFTQFSILNEKPPEGIHGAGSG